MKTVNIFHNASVKLTTVYLIIIMFISLVFSFGLYRVSTQELERSIRRPDSPLEQLVRRGNQDLHKRLISEQNEELTEARERLRGDLIIINIYILVVGGLLSYFMARKTMQPIEEAHDAQSRFTADASHELRTPITAMRAETELALTDTKLTLKQAKDQLASNMEELDKLTALSDGLLTLARLDNNGLETSPVLLSKIIDNAIERVEPLASKKKQTIKKSKIPKTKVRVDKLSIVEALVTLLDNAVKYSPEKSIISVKNKINQRSIEIEITDRGSGIKAGDLRHVFDRFYRADQSRNKPLVNGYGIGLSIAKGTVEAHAGTISVKSSPGNGSTFTISLPR